MLSMEVALRVLPITGIKGATQGDGEELVKKRKMSRYMECKVSDFKVVIMGRRMGISVVVFHEKDFAK